MEGSNSNRQQYPQRWRVFWFGAALVVFVMIAAALTLTITDPEKLTPLALSTVFYAAIVGFIFKTFATALWRRRNADAAKSTFIHSKEGEIRHEM